MSAIPERVKLAQICLTEQHLQLGDGGHRELFWPLPPETLNPPNREPFSLLVFQAGYFLSPQGEILMPSQSPAPILPSTFRETRVLDTLHFDFYLIPID